MDFMKLDGKILLHVVDLNSKFRGPYFFLEDLNFDFCEVFLSVSVSAYIGYLECVAVDPGLQFQSTEWKDLLQASKISYNRQVWKVPMRLVLGSGIKYFKANIHQNQNEGCNYSF